MPTYPFRTYLIAALAALAFFAVAAVVAGSSSAKADEMPCQNCVVKGAATAHVANSDAGGYTLADGGCANWLLSDGGSGGCVGWLYNDGGPVGIVEPFTVLSSAGAKLAIQCPKTSSFPSGQVVYYEPGSSTTPPDGGQVHPVLDFGANPDPYGVALRSNNDRFVIGAVDGGGYDCNIFNESP